MAERQSITVYRGENGKPPEVEVDGESKGECAVVLVVVPKDGGEPFLTVHASPLDYATAFAALLRSGAAVAGLMMAASGEVEAEPVEAEGERV